MGATAFADLVDVSVADGAGPARVEAFAAFRLVPGGPEEAERGRFAGTDLVGSSGQPDEGDEPGEGGFNGGGASDRQSVSLSCGVDSDFWGRGFDGGRRLRSVERGGPIRPLRRRWRAQE